MKISPSILAADLCELGVAVDEVSAYGADYIHVDVMDGHFAPNHAFGPELVKSLRGRTDLPIDVHLMVKPIDKRILQSYAFAGASFLTIHFESGHLNDIRHMLHWISDDLTGLSLRAGIAISPNTPIKEFKDFWYKDMLDFITVMGVQPGFAGQKFIDTTPDRVKEIRNIVGPDVEIMVDGGINFHTIESVFTSGADTIVAGAAIFGTGNIRQNLDQLSRGYLPEDTVKYA